MPLFFPEDVEKFGACLLSLKTATNMYHCYVRHMEWPRGQYLFWSGLTEEDRILAIRYPTGFCEPYVPTKDEAKSVFWCWTPPWELLPDGKPKRGSRKRLRCIAEENEEKYRQSVKEAEELKRAEEQRRLESEASRGLTPIERVNGVPTLESLMRNWKP